MPRPTVANAEILIRCREGFRASGISARVVEPGERPDAGHLACEWWEAFDDACRIGAYVVFSYATPIAWIDAYGVVTVPDTRYSVTTSRHQRLAREGFGVRVNTPAPVAVCALAV